MPEQPKAELIDCPACGGYVDFDEDGRPHTCYVCCNTGCVSREVADEYTNAQEGNRS